MVAETVGEVLFAMDSVFLGEAERQTVALDLPGARMTIAEHWPPAGGDPS